MIVEQLKSSKGSLLNCIFVIDEDNVKYCFVYEKLVAKIINGLYIEFQGEKYHSRTSNKFKKMFRERFNVKEDC